MDVFKKTMAAALGVAMLTPALAMAQTSTTSTASLIQSLLTQIKTLQEQILALQQQQHQTMVQLVATLNEGSKGDNVKTLQEWLAQDPSLYPEGLITGYYGRLTAEAVRRFQKKHGIEQLGIVGPRTRAKLNEIFGKAIKNAIKEINKNNDDDDDDDDDDNWSWGSGTTTVPGIGKVMVCHKPGKSNETIHIATPALQAHLNHGDVLGTCGGGGTSTTTPDTTAPNITNVSASNVTLTGASILWTTNEGATSQVEYGTSASYGATTTLDSTLVTSHSVALSGLLNSTMYHFRVLSKDLAGNSAMSGDMTFTTGTPDTAAPIISGVSVTPIGTTTASVNWTTNEAASSKVYYGTSTPVDLLSALSVSNATLVTTHSLGLSGLSASTTYYFVVESKDAANNTATTTSASFLTL